MVAVFEVFKVFGYAVFGLEVIYFDIWQSVKELYRLPFEFDVLCGIDRAVLQSRVGRQKEYEFSIGL